MKLKNADALFFKLNCIYFYLYRFLESFCVKKH